MPPVKKVKNRNGFKKDTAVSREYNGTSEGVHTVHLGVCSIPSVKTPGNEDSPWFLLGMAILRRILKKHYNVNVLSAYQQLDALIPPLYHTQSGTVKSQSQLVSINFYRKFFIDAQNNSSIAVLFNIAMPIFTDPASNKQVWYVATKIGTELQKYFGRVYQESVVGNNASYNFSDYNGNSLYGYSLEEMKSMGNLDTDATTRVMSPIMRLDNTIFSMSYTTKIRIQNISPVQINAVGSTMTEYDGADGLEQNTLVGKIYHFPDPYPIPSVKIDAVSYSASAAPSVTIQEDRGILSNDSNGDGIVKPNGSDISSLRFIPTPDQFLNCKSYSLVKLRPGENKQLKTTFYFRGFINKLINGLVISAGFNATNGAIAWTGRLERNRGFGTHDLFCFEDYNGGHGAGGNNPNIRISYQVNRFGACKYIKQVQEGMELIRSYAVPVTTINADA